MIARAFAVVVLLIVSAVPAIGQDDCLVHTALPWWMPQLPDENFANILFALEDNGICPVLPGDTMTFSSEEHGLTAVVGPVDVPTGFWTFTAETSSEYYLVEVVEMSECAPKSFSGAWGRGNLFSSGLEVVVTIEEACTVLFQVGDHSEPQTWKISAERLSLSR